MMNKKNLPHIITVVSFVVFIVLGLASASAPDQTGTQSGTQRRLYSAEDYYKRGQENSKNGNYELAIEDYTEVIRLGSNNNAMAAAGYNARAWIYAYYMKTNYDRALADANQALRLAPNNASYLDTRGWVYLGKGDYNNANDDFFKALQIDPNMNSSKEGLEKIREAQAEEVIDWSEFE